MFGDLGKIMKIAGEMKRKMPELQAKLASTEYSAEAGGGAVKATVNGKMQLTDLKIGPQVITDGNAAMIEDLIKAAVSSAQQQAARAAEAAMKEITGGISLPGMDGFSL